MKILFLASNPEDEGDGLLGLECREIREGIKASKYREKIEFESLFAVRVDDLIHSLEEHQPQMIHFAGHGADNNKLVMLNQDDLSVLVSPESLAKLFLVVKPHVRLIVFCACNTAGIAKLCAEVADCTIGVDGEIDVNGCITFAKNFYRALGNGESVQQAFEQSTATMRLTDQPEAELLRIYYGNDVKVGAISIHEGLVDDSENNERPPEPLHCPSCGQQTQVEKRGYCPLTVEVDADWDVGEASYLHEHGRCTLYKCLSCREPIVQIWTEHRLDEDGEIEPFIVYPKPPFSKLVNEHLVPFEIRRLLLEADRCFHNGQYNAFGEMACRVMHGVCTEKGIPSTNDLERRIVDGATLQLISTEVAKRMHSLSKLGRRGTIDNVTEYLPLSKISAQEGLNLLIWIVGEVYGTNVPPVPEW